MLSCHSAVESFERFMAGRRASFQRVFSEVNGATGPETMPLLAYLNEHLTYWRVRGHVGEIGVYYGRYLLGLAQFAADAERAVGIDLFADQAFNLDQAGIGQLDVFQANIAAHAPDPAAFDIVSGDSTKFHNEHLFSEFIAKYQAFKIFSVDGCHTAQHTMADIDFGARILANGGLLVIDDYGNPGWAGVVDGTSRYFAGRNIRLAPLFVGFNKLVCTTISHQPLYFEAVTEWTKTSSATTRYDWIKTLNLFGYPIHHFGLFKGL